MVYKVLVNWGCLLLIITPYDKKYVKKEFDEFIRETGYTFGLTHLNDGGITELEELYGECLTNLLLNLLI